MRQDIITSDRLVLRPFQMQDAKQVQALAGDPKIAEYTMNVPHPYEDGMAEAWIATHAERLAAGTDLKYAITDKTSGDLMGAIGLLGINGQECILGYWIGVPYWGQGYMTEATKALFNYSFANNIVKVIKAEYLAANLASGKVMAKAGMTYDGESRKANRHGEDSLFKHYIIRRQDV